MSFSPVTPQDLAEFGLTKVVEPSSTRLHKPTGTEKDINTELFGPNPQTQPSPSSTYAGDYKPSEEEQKPLNVAGYVAINLFKTPAHLVSAVKPALRNGQITLHKWQLDQSIELAESFKEATSLHPYRLALCAANGSGKDYFVIAPFVIWTALTQVRCLVLITSSSGTQLTAQTENYIATLAREFNDYAIQLGLVQPGQKAFHVRQRYIRCNLSGAEVRMFATDEAGKAEGYHPLEPDAKMVIIVNEAKSVSEEIFEALTRCTGFSHWLNISTPGEPKGSFYDSFINWSNTRHVTTYDCPHLPEEGRADDRRKYGEHSALYRSKHLALFTTLGGTCIISLDLVNSLLLNPPSNSCPLPERIGIDIAAGGDENAVCRARGNKILQEENFHERDTTITADRLERILLSWNISKTHEHIYADDGGVGHAVIDMLVRRGWNINRMLNQSAAVNKKGFGNRGAELWFFTKRLIEERLLDITSISAKTRTQLTTRQYKQSDTGGRIFLESKKEAKAHGRPSPDRADALVLTCCGFNLDEYIGIPGAEVASFRTKTTLKTEQDIVEYYENNVTFAGFNKPRDLDGKKIYNSLGRALKQNDN